MEIFDLSVIESIVRKECSGDYCYYEAEMRESMLGDHSPTYYLKPTSDHPDHEIFGPGTYVALICLCDNNRISFRQTRRLVNGENQLHKIASEIERQLRIPVDFYRF